MLKQTVLDKDAVHEKNVQCTTDHALSWTDSPESERLPGQLQWPAQVAALSQEQMVSLTGDKFSGQLSMQIINSQPQFVDSHTCPPVPVPCSFVFRLSRACSKNNLDLSGIPVP